MKKILKRIAIILLILLILAGVVFSVALYNINNFVQRYKPEIETMASEAVGSEVTLGKLGVSLFPSARVTLSDIQIRNEADEKLLVEEVSLYLHLRPLLRKELKITTLTLSGPEITLISDEAGMHIAGLPLTPTDDTEQRPA